MKHYEYVNLITWNLILTLHTCEIRIIVRVIFKC